MKIFFIWSFLLFIQYIHARTLQHLAELSQADKKLWDQINSGKFSDLVKKQQKKLDEGSTKIAQNINKLQEKTTQLQEKIQSLNFITNIDNNNWIRGNLTIEDVLKIYKKQNQTAPLCPVQKPFFFNKTACIDCSGNNNIWNLQKSQCQSCPSGQMIDLKQRNCEKIQIACLKFFNKSQNSCDQFKICQNKWLNRIDNSCMDKKDCQGNFYNETTNSCRPKAFCQKNPFYNAKQNKCEAYAICQGNTILNKVTNKCETTLV